MHPKELKRLDRIRKARQAYSDMKQRCYNRQAPNYIRYGGRGITVCYRWRKSFKNFLKDMGLPGDNLSLDRINNLKGYSKSNCRWATIKQQCRNKSDNRKVYQYSLDGVFLNKFDTVAEASENTGTCSTSIYHILNKTGKQNRFKANNFIWKPGK